MAELRAIEDREAQMSVALLLDAMENAAAARAALAAASDGATYVIVLMD